MKIFRWIILAALGAVACGGGSATSQPVETAPSPSASASAAPSASAQATPAPLAIAPMKLTVPPYKIPFELRADGSLVDSTGHTKLKFVGAELQDPSGKMVVSVAPDGDVTTMSGQKGLKFSATDELVYGKGKISVGDDGVATNVNPYFQQPDEAKVKFIGFTPTARRAAALLAWVLYQNWGDFKTAAPSAKPAHS